MTQFNKELILEKCHQLNKNTLMEHFDITYTDAGQYFLTAQMPVSAKVLQSHGVLHGGATAALAESVGSMAAHIFFAKEGTQISGIKLSADHVRSVSEGVVTATANCIHSGKTLQLWDIKITDEQNKLVSVCSLTTIAISKK